MVQVDSSGLRKKHPHQPAIGKNKEHDNLTSPRLALSISDTELDQQLNDNPAVQKFSPLQLDSSRSWLDQLEQDSADVILVQVDEFDAEDLEQLQSSGLLAHAEIFFVSKGEPNPFIDKAMMLGVAYHLRFPVDQNFVAELLEELLLDLESRQSHSKQVLTSNLDQFGLLVGSSRSMRKLYRIVRKAAASPASVLVIGESGAGKELVANTLHLMSERRDEPFLTVNCGAISPELIESELFGHVKGAFTGANDDRTGIFAQADGGTLFLDEVTEMPVDQQVKLLRVLESGEYRKVGSDHASQSNVRVIAATNREPADAIQNETFREDLYFRLAQFPLRVPPLRERGDDIEGLARHFLAHRNAEQGTAMELTDAALEKILNHGWPGNVRELKHCIERAYILADEVIDAEHIVLEDSSEGNGDASIPTSLPLDEVEKQVILKTLAENDGKKKETAEQLGISVKTLYNKLEKYEDSADSD